MVPTFRQSIFMVAAGAGLLVLAHFFKDLSVYFLPAGGGLLMASNIWGTRRPPDPPPAAPK